MGYPSDRVYSKDHEWAKNEDGVAVVGITDFAQNSLGDIVYVDLPAVGDQVSAGDSFGEVESVKSVSELIAPITGEVVEVNEVLEDAPETVNSDPHGEGWMIKIKMDDASELDTLMPETEYTPYIGG